MPRECDGEPCKVIDYFELPELPGRKHFACTGLAATLSVESCADNWRGARARTHDRRRPACSQCPIGAVHAGDENVNLSTLYGTSICARCHRTGSRLVGKHLCLSCYNREREVIKGANAKGTAPVKHPPLDLRTVFYRAGDECKTKTVARSTSTEEMMVAVLRDEPHQAEFAWGGHLRMQALLRECEAQEGALPAAE
jgi:hypothetical protein